jgi:hypothetical protein
MTEQNADYRALTAEDLEAGIAKALEARDMPAVVDFLRVLVTVDPQRAALVYDTLTVGIALNRAHIARYRAPGE